MALRVIFEETSRHPGTTLLARRLVLAPRQATWWYRDSFHRGSVVFSGDVVAMEFRDGTPGKHVKITPGQVDWDGPSERILPAVNIGDGP